MKIAADKLNPQHESIVDLFAKIDSLTGGSVQRMREAAGLKMLDTYS